MRAKLIALRAAAAEQVFRAFKKRPPYVHVSEDVDSLSAKARRALAHSLFRRCRAKQDTATLRKLDGLPFGWVVPCPNRLPPQFATNNFRLTLGSWTAAQVAQDYSRHIPVSGLFDDTVLKALLSE
jgi:hypothetical protein